MTRKYTPTPEQKEASAQRREKLRAIVKQLSEMDTAKRVELFGDRLLVSCAGREYSVFNTCFALSQNPNATVLGGFDQWRQVGRKVKKGAHAVALFKRTERKEQNAEATDEPTAEDATPSRRPKFIFVNVFDIEDTEPIDASATDHDERRDTARPAKPTQQPADFFDEVAA